MSTYVKYPLVLGTVAALSGLLLYGTFILTHEASENQKKGALGDAVNKVFFFEKDVTAVPFSQDDPKSLRVYIGPERPGEEADFYAAVGEGVGYNAAKPIVLLAGFTNPQRPSVRFGTQAESVLVGWFVIDSEETPGLGEKIKDATPTNTVFGLLEGDAGYTGTDPRTEFQRQFSDPAQGRLYAADALKTSSEGGPIDVITGATYTTKGVIAAIRNASDRIAKARAGAN